MKLYLISAILLVVPMAFADLPVVIGKVIYHQGHVLTDLDPDDQLEYRHSSSDLHISFGDSMLSLSNVVNDEGYANLSFAVESLVVSDLRKYDCVEETEESLRHLVRKSFSTCFGATRLRSLTQKEIGQMEKFKSNPDEISRKFKVIHKKGSLTSRSVGLDRLRIYRNSNSLYVRTEERNFDRGYFSSEIRKLRLYSYQIFGKTLVIEGTATKVDCEKTDLENLMVADCHGRIHARSLNDEDVI